MPILISLSSPNGSSVSVKMAPDKSGVKLILTVVITFRLKVMVWLLLKFHNVPPRSLVYAIEQVAENEDVWVGFVSSQFQQS